MLFQIPLLQKMQMDIDAEKLGQELALNTTQKMADSIEINSKFILSIFIFE